MTKKYAMIPIQQSQDGNSLSIMSYLKKKHGTNSISFFLSLQNVILYFLLIFKSIGTSKILFKYIVV